jgi:hypothetical protein
MLHHKNTFISTEIFTLLRDNMKSGGVNREEQCRADAIAALIANNAPPEFLYIGKDKRLIAKLKCSILKRLRKLLKVLRINSCQRSKS